MKAIWSQDEAGFDGDLVRFEPIWSWPKPVQRPHPPVVLGAHGRRALERVVDYCDGWIPIGVRAGDLAIEIERLRGMAAEKGRDPHTLSVNLYGAPRDRDALARLRDAGVTRAIFALPAEEADRVLPMLDRCAEAMRGI
jgi:alkanesulfonate monooxygenase SsuD/methylene tetrahydromethanopterin reductase-like flavin-dependent oxidoreductase (luciferase family)